MIIAFGLHIFGHPHERTKEKSRSSLLLEEEKARKLAEDESKGQDENSLTIVYNIFLFFL